MVVTHTCNSIGQEAKGTQEDSKASLDYTDPVSKTYKMGLYLSACHTWTRPGFDPQHCKSEQTKSKNNP